MGLLGSVFGWVRRQAHDAFLAGIGDAVQELANGDGSSHGEAVAALMARLTPQLPAPVEEPTKGKGRKVAD
jgi:hypothetical protein